MKRLRDADLKFIVKRNHAIAQSSIDHRCQENNACAFLS